MFYVFVAWLFSGSFRIRLWYGLISHAGTTSIADMS